MEKGLTFESVYRAIQEGIEKTKIKNQARKVSETFNIVEPSWKQKKVFTWWRKQVQ